VIRVALLTGIAAASIPCVAFAGPAPVPQAGGAQQDAEESGGLMSEVIVTATATGVKKIDASYSVVKG
jgi:hypothetical protein